MFENDHCLFQSDNSQNNTDIRTESKRNLFSSQSDREMKFLKSSTFSHTAPESNRTKTTIMTCKHIFVSTTRITTTKNKNTVDKIPLRMDMNLMLLLRVRTKQKNPETLMSDYFSFRIFRYILTTNAIKFMLTPRCRDEYSERNAFLVWVVYWRGKKESFTQRTSKSNKQT